MELIKSSVGDRFFNEKVRPALRLMEIELKNRPVGTVALSYNGGKDCTVLLELLELSGLLSRYNVKIITFREEDPFQEVTNFMVRRLEQHLKRVLWCASDIQKEMEYLVNNYTVKSVLLGQRIGDPYCPASAREESSPGWPVFMRVNPIRDWNYCEVWEFLLAVKAQYCPLYDLGYSSLGAAATTAPNRELAGRPAYMLCDLESEREGR